MYSWQFSKNFPSPKVATILIFKFLPKMAKYKFASISLTVRDRVISSKFSTHSVTEQCTLGYFQKNFPLRKNGGHFEFLPKMAEHKFASIFLTVRHRAISSKFSTHRLSEQCTLGNFQKNFPSPKMAAILYFRIFAKKWKSTNLLLSP